MEQKSQRIEGKCAKEVRGIRLEFFEYREDGKMTNEVFTEGGRRVKKEAMRRTERTTSN